MAEEEIEVGTYEYVKHGDSYAVFYIPEKHPWWWLKVAEFHNELRASRYCDVENDIGFEGQTGDLDDAPLHINPVSKVAPGGNSPQELLIAMDAGQRLEPLIAMLRQNLVAFDPSIPIGRAFGEIERFSAAANELLTRMEQVCLNFAEAIYKFERVVMPQAEIGAPAGGANITALDPSTVAGSWAKPVFEDRREEQPTPDTAPDAPAEEAVKQEPRPSPEPALEVAPLPLKEMASSSISTLGSVIDDALTGADRLWHALTKQHDAGQRLNIRAAAEEVNVPSGSLTFTRRQLEQKHIIREVNKVWLLEKRPEDMPIPIKAEPPKRTAAPVVAAVAKPVSPAAPSAVQPADTEWTFLEDSKLSALLKEGMPTRGIAVILNRSHEDIHDRSKFLRATAVHGNEQNKSRENKSNEAPVPDGKHPARRCTGCNKAFVPENIEECKCPFCGAFNSTGKIVSKPSHDPAGF